LVQDTRRDLLPGQIIRVELNRIPEGLFFVNIMLDNKITFSKKMIKTAFR
jgi:hypothetical protein